MLDIKNIKNIRKKWRIVGDDVGGAVSLQEVFTLPLVFRLESSWSPGIPPD